MVRIRVLYGSIMIFVLVGLTILDAYASSAARVPSTSPLSMLGRGGLTTLVVGLIVLGGAVELLRMVRKAGYRPTTGWCLAMVVLMVLAPWLAMSKPAGSGCPIMAACSHLAQLDRHLPWFAIVGAGCVLVWRQQTDGATGNLAVSLMTMFYIGYLGSFAVRIRCWQPGGDGAWLLLATLGVIKICDIGAYFTGRAIGRTPLIPKVSPKKTWEGTLGGVLLAGLAGILFLGILMPRLLHDSVAASLSLPQVFVFGVVMGAVGQFGDLVESLFKRDCGAKDSARLVPEFGGVLDVIDSPLFCLPVAWALLRWWTQAG